MVLKWPALVLKDGSHVDFEQCTQQEQMYHKNLNLEIFTYLQPYFRFFFFYGSQLERTEPNPMHFIWGRWANSHFVQKNL